MQVKALAPALVLVAALAAPVVAFAQQSNAPVTRAQVRAELVQLENAGYRGGDNAHYPVQILAAEARVAAHNGTAQAGSSSVGGVVSGSSASGAPAPVVGLKPIYFGGGH